MARLAASPELSENARDVSLSVDNRDDLKRGLVWPIHDGVVGLPIQRPETKRTNRDIRAGMAAEG